jgi:hypothetical protein
MLNIVGKIRTLHAIEDLMQEYMQCWEARQHALEVKLYLVIARVDGVGSFSNILRMGTLHSS